MNASTNVSKREYKGKNGSIIVSDTGITLKSKGFLRSKAFGDEIIPYRSITAIKFRRAGWLFEGALELRIAGLSDGRYFVPKHIITFRGKKKNQDFEEVRLLIEQNINRLTSVNQNIPSNTVNELERLVTLKEKGVITEEEFQVQKQKILSIK